MAKLETATIRQALESSILEEITAALCAYTPDADLPIQLVGRQAAVVKHHSALTNDKSVSAADDENSLHWQRVKEVLLQAHWSHAILVDWLKYGSPTFRAMALELSVGRDDINESELLTGLKLDSSSSLLPKGWEEFLIACEGRKFSSHFFRTLLASKAPVVKIAALDLMERQKTFIIPLIEEVLMNSEPEVVDKALEICSLFRLNEETTTKWLNSGYDGLMAGAIKAGSRICFVDKSVIFRVLKHRNSKKAAFLAAQACEHKALSKGELRRLTWSWSPKKRLAAAFYFKSLRFSRSEIEDEFERCGVGLVNFLEDFIDGYGNLDFSEENLHSRLKDSNPRLLGMAMWMLESGRIPTSILDKWGYDLSWPLQKVAIEMLDHGWSSPRPFVEEVALKGSYPVRQAAIDYFTHRPLPVSKIRGMLLGDDSWLKEAAVPLLKGRIDITPEVRKKVAKNFYSNKSDSICSKLGQVYRENGWFLPLIRSFTPPKLVYRKCLQGVIVAAEIPHDAQVRGEPGGLCRADKAIIRQISGNFYGEKVGISIHDPSIGYRVGDTVEIPDFDFSEDPSREGFHFVTTYEQAKNL